MKRDIREYLILFLLALILCVQVGCNQKPPFASSEKTVKMKFKQGKPKFVKCPKGKKKMNSRGLHTAR